MKNKKRFIIIPVLLLALTLQLALGACSAPVIACFTDRDNTPERCYEQFVDLMARERYYDAEQYIINYETLGFTDRPDDSFSSLIFNAIARSRTGRVIERLSDQGHKVTLRVEFTTFDFKLIEPALSEKTSALVYDTQYAGQEVSSSDQYEQAMLQCLQELLEQPQNYYRTAEFELDFELRDGKWKMYSTEAFYSALIGYSL